MEWVTLGLMIGVALWTYLHMPKIPKITNQPGEIECPICEDGAPIPVVFGTVCLKGANTTWWGGVETSKTDNGELLYYISMRMCLCHGTIDGVLATYVGEKDAKIDPMTSDEQSPIKIRKPYLLGTGDWTGMLAGKIRYRMGRPNFLSGTNNPGVYSVPSEINGETGGLGPGFFGIACVELEHMLVGGSPYLQPWAFVVQRIAKRNSSGAPYNTVAQWLPDKCYIPHGVTGETKWEVSRGDSLTVPGDDKAAWYTSNYPTDTADWVDGYLRPMPFGQTTSVPTGLPSVVAGDENFGWEAGTHLWTRTYIRTDQTDEKLLKKIYLFVYCENAAWVWIDDVYVGSTNPTNAAVNGSNANFDVTDKIASAGVHKIVVYALDEDPGDATDSTYIYARVVTSPVVDNNVDAATLYSYRDMNPAHIIRECLTDPVWGMGYLDADIDEPTFAATAATLYEERFGISILWSKPGSIADFIGEILRHINGTLFLDRYTGKYKLTLVREPSSLVPEVLVSLGDDSIERIEDVSRRATGELVNQVTVSYTSGAMGEAGTVTVTEPGLVQSQGAVINSKLEYPGITTHDLASRVALRDLRALSARTLSCTVIASRKAAVLNPGDRFLLTRSEYGLSNTVMRVASIELGDGRSNRVRIKCVEDVFANVDHNIMVPPGNPWTNPTPTPITAPDPGFVDTFKYKSEFLVASLTDKAVKQSVDAVFCYSIGGSSPPFTTLFNQRFPGDWYPVRPGVWRAMYIGQAFLEQHLNGVTAFKGMRVIAAWLGQSVESEAALESEDLPRSGIYVVTDPGFYFDEQTRQYTPTYAQLERAEDFSSGDQLENGCVVRIGGGAFAGSEGTLSFAGKYARLTTAAPITLGTTALAWELPSSYSAVRGDNLLTPEQAAQYGDAIGNEFNLSATSAEPSTWITFPTLEGTPNAQTYPAGRTKWKALAAFVSGDASATTKIECQTVAYTDINNVTVLAEADSDQIVGDGLSEYTTHADVNDDQAISGKRVATRYRVTTTSTSQVVVRFVWGESGYRTRVLTPLVVGAPPDGFVHTPYGPAIPIGADGILKIPDVTKCSGTIRVSGSELKGIDTTGFVGGDSLSIRFTTDCTVRNGESVRTGAAGIDLTAFSGLSGDDADLGLGARSHVKLQYDDLIGAWEVAGQPTIKEPTI